MKYIKIYMSSEADERINRLKTWSYGIALGNREIDNQLKTIVKPIKEDINENEYDLIYREANEVHFTDIPTIHGRIKRKDK